MFWLYSTNQIQAIRTSKILLNLPYVLFISGVGFSYGIGRINIGMYSRDSEDRIDDYQTRQICRLGCTDSLNMVPHPSRILPESESHTDSWGHFILARYMLNT